jgi:hypothetical protein
MMASINALEYQLKLSIDTNNIDIREFYQISNFTDDLAYFGFDALGSLSIFQSIVGIFIGTL